MSVETSLANIVIRNNTIDQGRFSDGVSPITYNYDFCASILGSSMITGNSFLSAPPLPATPTDMLNLHDCSCVITSNKFARGSTSINSYIRNYGANDQMITNNIFDQSTVDGAIDILAIGLSSSSSFYDNKNQIVYVPITLVDKIVDSKQSLTGGTIYSQAIAPGAATITQLSDFNTYFHVRVADLVFNWTKCLININAAIPKNVTILEAKIGLYGINSGATTVATAGHNFFDIDLFSQSTVPANYSTGVNSILDSLNKSTVTLGAESVLYDTHANYATVIASTVYITLPIPTPSQFVNDDSSSILARVSMVTHLSVAGEIIWDLSPLVIKCRW